MTSVVLVCCRFPPIPHTAKWLDLHVEDKVLCNLSCSRRMWKCLTLRAGEIRAGPVEGELGCRGSTGKGIFIIELCWCFPD